MSRRTMRRYDSDQTDALGPDGNNDTRCGMFRQRKRRCEELPKLLDVSGRLRGRLHLLDQVDLGLMHTLYLQVVVIHHS